MEIYLQISTTDPLPCQFGFRPNFSTEAALIEITDFMKQSIDCGLFAAAIFVDLTKAFDSITHDILFSKLESLGVCGPTLALLQSYLADRLQAVECSGILSEYKTVNIGVPQGSILGPLLFLLFINDLPSCLNFSKCMLYADDTTVYLADSDLSNLTKKLNDDLIRLSDWCRNNRLNINPSKTSFIIFHSHHKQITPIPHLRLGTHFIYPSDYTTFLGVVLDKHLKFHLHIKSLISKVAFGIHVLIRTRAYFPLPVLRSLYNCFVHSHLTYCLGSWGSTYDVHLSPLVSLQNRAIRIINYSHPRDSAPNLYFDLRILPLLFEYKIKMCIFLLRARNNESMHTCIDQSLLFNANNTRFSENNNLILPKIRSNYGKQTAVFAAISMWNELPTPLKSIHSPNFFRNQLKSFLLSTLA